MERNLNNEDFEEFLKLKTDHYKLYPSDKVWKGIHQSLHTRKRWFRIGGSLLFLSTLLFFNSQFNHKNPADTAPQAVRTVPATDKLTETKPQATGIENVIIATSIAKGTKAFRKKEQPAIPANDTKWSDVIAPSSLVTPQLAERQSEITTAILTAPVDPKESKASELISPDETATVNETPTPGETVKEHKAAISTQADRIHDGSDINWLQEMAAIKIISPKRHRFNLQFYFSPTISYRKLADGEKMKDLSNVPLARNQLGVNNFVDHKPSIGLELGSNLLFAPSRNLTLKSGLQLNYSRYTIKAYKFYFEKANIALLSPGRSADTMSSYTSLRNFNGYFPEDLQNQYLQLSLPVGAELKVLGNKRLQLNVAGTIQPSYLLYNDAYLLSSDFINYIKEPSLVRKWNVNTSAEAFVSYYMGGMRWQVGPQFRYQTLSSYNDRYPIREYLIEYGVKFGVSKTLR